MAEHKTLPDAELHEPKGAATAVAGTVYISDGAGSGSWVKSTGWETHLDGTYTSSSPRALSANTKYKVTIDSTALDLSDSLAVWDTSTNKLVTEGANFCYSIRLDFKCSAASAGIVDLTYEAGVTLLTRTLSIAKGSNVTNNLVSALEVFTGPIVVTNGGLEFYITPSVNIDAWDFGIFIVRSHYAA